VPHGPQPVLDAAARIRGHLARVRSLATRRALGGAAWMATGAVLAALVVGAWILGVVPRSAIARYAVLAVALVGAAGPLVAALVRIRRVFGADAAVAARLESSFPALRSDVRAALEFADPARPASDDTARALRDRLVLRIADGLDAKRARLGDAAPAADLRPARGLLVGAVALLVVGLLAAPATLTTGASALVFGPPTVTESGAAVVQQPLVGAIDLLVTPPSWTHRPPARIVSSTGDVRALAGSTVAVSAVALQPAESARLVVVTDAGETPIAMSVEDQRILTAEFVVDTAGSWRVEVTPPGEPRVADPVERSIRIEPDQPPRVELIAPTSGMEVTPDHVVNLEFIASDDFGLGDVRLVWHFVGDEDRPREVPLQNDIGLPSHQEHVPFELAPLRLQPRDEVVVWIEATDQHGLDGPQTGTSRAITLRVASPDDHHAEVLALKEQLFEVVLAQLAATLPPRLATWASADDALVAVPREGTDAERAERLRGALTGADGWVQVHEVFGALVEAMAADELSATRDAELLTVARAELYEAERDHRRRLDAVEVGANRGAVTATAYGPVALSDADLIERTERIALLLQDLIALHRSDDLQRTVEELSEIRDRLAELLEQYRETQDPELRAQIEEELRRLESRMRELMQRMAAQVEQLPVEHLNAEGLERSEMAEQVGEMTSSLDQLRDLFESGDIDGALAALESLESSLEGMMGQLDQHLDGATPDGVSEFDEAMAELMDEVNDLEQAEQAIEAETSELLEQMLAEREAEMREELDARIEAARELVAEMEARHADAGDDRLPIESRQALRATQDALERLDAALARDDVAGAEEEATRLMPTLHDLAWQLRRDEALVLRDNEARGQVAQQRRATEQNLEQITGLSRSLRSLMEQSRPRPTPGQQQAMDGLAERQSEVGERLSELQQQMDAFGERFPIGEGAGQPLQQASEAMQQAEGALRQGRPRPAMQGEMQALEGLRTMRQQLQQMTQRQRRQDQQQSQGSPRDRVDIPGEGEGGRRAFRDDVVDAMREGGLDSWDDEIRRYYETLLE